MTCPSCSAPLEPTARFCGVCGYRLASSRPPAAGTGAAQVERAPRGHIVEPPSAPLPAPQVPRVAQARPVDAPGKPAAPHAAHVPGAQAQGAHAQAAQGARAQPKARPKPGDDIYINQVLNNRFKVESKIGEGGFGAVYRGVQLATGRKVALKLLHPEMTKDENLVARFRREGMVLCNLRDAHTITTYDFDQTPDGTLYIAMELLEGKSLHQVFHEEAPLDWKRVFKVLTEMCSSLYEAHTQGIVHRDLKPENIYLEARPGNPEFVKILDFGIAKVMRGDTIDPQSPQLTATGQTLGTLEYMSPEQLMGKALDGRSDVYALGVLAYEMITGRLPFPDAKGPAGLITAQLKQTPMAPSLANPAATLPKAADRAILKCLEKDKNNRYPDVSALAAALQDVVSGQSSEIAALKQPAQGANHRPSPNPMLERPPAHAAPASVAPVADSGRSVPALPVTPMPAAPRSPGGPGVAMSAMPVAPMAPIGEPVSGLAPMGPQFSSTPHGSQVSHGSHGMHGSHGSHSHGSHGGSQPPVMTPATGSPVFAPRPMTPTPYPPPPVGALMHGGTSMPMGSYPQSMHYPPLQRSSKKLLWWWILALLAVGAGVGTALALLLGD